ncbi:MAG: hypothetical protein JW747_03900 [Candidatus Aminicenantes bacterium]|nr:hypothetical protein [Candidatus Aminicenantes bacterium]
MSRKKVLAAACAALFLWSCDVSINRSRHLADGERSSGMTTVNGSIVIGAGCEVDGGCRTVNGRVAVGDGSRVEDLDTVNGSIVVGDDVTVDGDARTVNGSLKFGPGSKVSGGVSTVNGSITLDNAVVSEDVVTVNGDVRLREKSTVGGDIVIRNRGNVFSRIQSLDIRIEGGSVVEGGIDVRDPDTRVRVYISKDSAVRGEIRNAEVIRE